MKSFTDWMEALPLWAKILFAIPALDIVWVVYRLVKSVETKNTLGVVLAIVLIFIGFPFLWLIDIITLAISNYIIWID